jgi:hypothetical protein
VKRIITFAIVGLLALALLIQLIPYGHDHSNPPVKAEPAWPSPQTRVLAQRACFDCHSDQTAWPWYSNIAPASWLVYGDVVEGRQRVNFSEWNRPEGQYVDEFKEADFENNMPPANYLLLHPSARLSPAQRKQLFDGLEIIAANFHP